MECGRRILAAGPFRRTEGRVLSAIWIDACGYPRFNASLETWCGSAVRNSSNREDYPKCRSTAVSNAFRKHDLICRVGARIFATSPVGRKGCRDECGRYPVGSVRRFAPPRRCHLRSGPSAVLAALLVECEFHDRSLYQPNPEWLSCVDHAGGNRIALYGPCHRSFQR